MQGKRARTWSGAVFDPPRGRTPLPGSVRCSPGVEWVTGPGHRLIQSGGSDVVGPVGHRAPKVPEGLEQAGLRLGGQVVRADIAERGDGFADLFHVPRATGAQIQVCFECERGVGVQFAFEVVGDQFAAGVLPCVTRDNPLGVRSVL